MEARPAKLLQKNRATPKLNASDSASMGRTPRDATNQEAKGHFNLLDRRSAAPKRGCRRHRRIVTPVGRFPLRLTDTFTSISMHPDIGLHRLRLPYSNALPVTASASSSALSLISISLPLTPIIS